MAVCPPVIGSYACISACLQILCTLRVIIIKAVQIVHADLFFTKLFFLRQDPFLGSL